MKKVSVQDIIEREEINKRLSFQVIKKIILDKVSLNLPKITDKIHRLSKYNFF